ncbi:MAG: SDR family oxidoreductase [Gammaproteobacteria bacterium]|nr:SDR family oxidoreductase [Gammaproteobacteria bacterium]
MLITGASRGIGAETALLAARNGFDVCVNFEQDEDAAIAVVEAVEAEGQRAIAVQANIAVESEVANLFKTVDRSLGRLTALVNNAAILEQQSDFENISLQRLKRVLDINVGGSFLCAREAVLRMSYKYGGDGGTIVNMSSRAAVLGSAHEFVDYAASKGAIDSMTIGLANEVGDQGIRVNAVRPGLIYTDMHASAGEPNRVDRMKSGVPMKRGGLPLEVAKAILWLSSEDSAYTTGTFIDVSGGR